VQLWGLYWAKTFWPKVLCLDYSINAVTPADSLLRGHALIGLVVLVVLAAWIWIACRSGAAHCSQSSGTPHHPQNDGTLHCSEGHGRLAVLLTAALFISYLPVSNTVLLIKTYFAERLWYAPSIWVAAMAGWALSWAWVRLKQAPKLRGLAMLIPAAACVLAAAGFARSWIRNVEWRDEGTLYYSAYRDHPTAVRALLLYGEWLSKHGYDEEGIDLLTRATLTDLGFTDAQRSLGAACLRAGQFDKAVEHLQIADVQIPGHPWTQRMLASARARLAESAARRVAEAEQAVGEHPDDLPALVRLADELVAAGRPGDAAARLLAAESRFSATAEYHRHLAAALVMANRREEAEARYRRALELSAEDVTSLVELATLLLDRRREGDVDEARRLVERAAAVSPASIPVALCRAELLVMDERRTEAAAIYRKIAASLPEGNELRRTCEIRAASLER